MESVLIVDDDSEVLQLLTQWVEAAGCRPRPFSDADQALADVWADPPAVALLTMPMWGHDGLWLGEQLRTGLPETAVVMVSGTKDVDIAIRCLRMGVVDYLLTPFGSETLRDAIVRALEWNRTALADRRRLEMIKREFRARQTQLTTALADAEGGYETTLEAMLALLRVRDRAEHDHSQRVARLAVNTAMVLGVKEPELSDIERGALLHDLGKIATPDAVLKKPAPLTTAEREIVQQHPQYGYEVVKNVGFLARAAEIVRGSHEWYGGRGYPQGLRGDDIPLGSRIVAAAEAYDSMVNTQLYRKPVSAQDAVIELARCRGTQFDPKVVDALINVVPM